MSKLIRDNNKNQGSEVAPALLPLSNKVIISHLKSCQQMASDHAKSAFKHYLKVLDDVFIKQIDRARSNEDANRFHEVQMAIRAKRETLEKYFSGYVAESFVRFKKKELNTTIGNESDGALDELSLVGNEDLDEAIAITSLTQRVDGYFAEPLWALNQRFAVLNGGEHVTEASNPAAPVQICEALRKSMKLVSIETEHKIVAYKVFDTQLINLMKLIIEDTNHFLKSQGILPNLKYTAPSGRVPDSYMSDESDTVMADALSAAQEGSPAEVQEHTPDASLPADQYQVELLGAIRGLQDQIFSAQTVARPSQLLNTGIPAGAVPVSEAELVAALQALQNEYQEVPEPTPTQQLVPIDVSTIITQLKAQLEAESKDGVVQQDSMHTIDLVGMLFEYMLNDENLPDRVKALLSHLHTPFLKIAFIDPGFFEKHDHPARLLLNKLAQAGAQWVGNDGTSQYGILEKIQQTVNRILKEFKEDVKIIAELLLDFSSHTKNIERRQELMEKRATEKVQGEEKLRQVKLKVNEEIRSRTEGKDYPSALLLFLLQPWTDYLSFALLRFGEGSDQWRSAISLVDELLWAVQAPRNRIG